MSSDRMRQLLQRLFKNQCTPKERQQLVLWIESMADDSDREALLEVVRAHFPAVKKMDPDQAQERVRRILEKGKGQETAAPQRKALATPVYRFSLVAGVAIAVLLVFSIRDVRKHFGPVAPDTAMGNRTDTGTNPPGGHKALLVLSNGTTIALDSAKNRTLAQLGDLQVLKQQNGPLVYKGKDTGSVHTGDAGAAPNRLHTPVGSQYQIVLPDGSKVWLNAASSLVFPTAFTGDQRQVEVRGEAYFEVYPDSLHPFVVIMQDERGVPVGSILGTGTGTRFNVKAYSDESHITATLLEGTVKVRGMTEKETQSGSSLRLSAGQQALVGQKGALVLAKADHPDAVIAWKNGLFDFEGIYIEAVMRQLSRWYNIEVQYEDTLSTRFMGRIARNAPLSEVLKMLELTGEVHFITQGKTVRVTR